MDKNLLIRFFEGQATTDEEMKVRKWMEASTENRRTYFKERKMYDMTLLLSKDTKKETVSQSSKKKFKFRKFIEIAAVAAITLVITLFYKNQERQEYWLTAQKISVPAGQRINLELSDGTKVWLNSRTKIEYPAVFADKERRIKLDGEAYFQVAQNIHKPFIVQTPKGNVEVLGTQFNVEAYADDKTITATLVEGSIAMAYENKKSNWTEQEIQPGQEIVYTAAQQQIKIDQADVEVITSWKDGKLIFRDTPFKEVLKMLSKRFDVDFVVKNPKCFEASFTGVLEKQRLGRILEYISVSSNIKFKYAESNNIHQEKQKIEVY